MTQKFLKSFVQRNRKLTRKQESLLNNTKFLINDFSLVLKDKNLYENINLEIGFGKGDFLINLARNTPDDLFIGSEPYLSGVLNVLQTSIQNNISNIRVFKDDIRLLLLQIKEEIFNKIFILFPDPWPKARHNKRRIINDYLINEIFRLLKKNGQLHIVTDSDDYSEWINDLFEQDQRFKQLSENLRLTTDNLNTSYHIKSKEKKNKVHVFAFCK